MIYTEKNLMRLKKEDLTSMIINLIQEKDELYDQKENLIVEIENIETYEDEYYELGEIKDIISRIRECDERIDLGILSDIDEKEKLMDKLLTYI